MSKYWNRLTASLKPYVPGEQPKDQKYIKINTNENPYPPSPAVVRAIHEAANADLRLYPDPGCDKLRDKIAEYYGLSREQIFIGNGSDEILAFAFQGFFSADEPILFPDITYSFYPVYAGLYGLSYQTIAVDEQFRITAEPYAIPNGGIIIANPNAPTAQAISLAIIRTMLDANPDRVVILDEAYVDFGGESAVSLIPEYPNLLVIQTLSKSRSLAGLRVGMAMGHAELIEGLNRIKNSFNSYTIDRLAIAGAIAAIDDEAYFLDTTRKVIETRDRTAAQLRRLGFIITDSKANFLFISHLDHSASELQRRLKQSGILVRHFNLPKIDNYLRVSIGTDQEMNTLVDALAALIKS